MATTFQRWYSMQRFHLEGNFLPEGIWAFGRKFGRKLGENIVIRREMRRKFYFMQKMP
jgi:hypothetical protein